MSTAFQETRTDRSPIQSKGGTLGMDRNVRVLRSATLEQCFLLSQAIIVVSQILKILHQLFLLAWETMLFFSWKCRYLQEY